MTPATESPADTTLPNVQAVRQARQQAQRMRQLAAERAVRLEIELKEAAETGIRAEISRGIAARARLQAERRKRSMRYAGVAALGLLLGAATSGSALVVTQQFEDAGRALAQASPVVAPAPGDKLNLAFSYSVSSPLAR